MNPNVFIVQNSDGQAIKASSSLELAFQWCKLVGFRYDFRELTGVTEFEVDGETWGVWHSFEEIEDR